MSTPERHDPGPARADGWTPVDGGSPARPVERIAVIGAGLVGGSVAAAARAAGARVTLTDGDPAVRARAAALDLADAVVDDVASAVAEADLVVVAVPAAVTCAVVVEAARHARPDAILTDVASLKSRLVPEVEQALADADLGPHRFLGGHPMAGSERSGPDAADAALFQGATWVLTPTHRTSEDVLTRTSAALDRLGVRILAVAPEAHDQLVAFTSHLPQLAASALASVAGDLGDRVGDAAMALVGGGFRDTTRIAASDPDLWVGILRGNRDGVLTALDALRDRLDVLRAALADGDDTTLRSVLDGASRTRRSLVRADAGIESVDLAIALDDRPGWLATATTALGEAGINVRDLAMRHADAGDRGALLVRIDAAVADRAIAALAAVDLPAHVERERAAAGTPSGPPAETPSGAAPAPLPGAGAEVRTIAPLAVPPDVTLTVPGSKSLTNRALVTAALATGTSVLRGALDADDTAAMIAGLRALGVVIDHDPDTATITVTGTAGVVPPGPVTVDARLSGTTARFLAPVLAAGSGAYVLDGHPPLRARPMGPTLAALRDLGAVVTELDGPDRLPVRIEATGLVGGRAVDLDGDASSQFLSGLLLVGPIVPGGLSIRLRTALVSAPYVHLTLAVMRAFGAEATWDGDRFEVAPTGYRATDHAIEPDASAASYLLAAAAITGGRVRVPGLGAGAAQGDARFADVLAAMGAEVVRDPDGIEVRGTGRLHGLEVDLGEMSDVAQTLAAVAVFADSPTRVTGIGFIRAKETDRIGAVVTELRRCGIDAVEEPDGFLIHPGTPRPATIRTYDDHRMAMSFALLGLRVPGIAIADPDCVAKTFPTYFEVLDRLRA